jgi:parallel beta-helix repeat protein
VGLGIAIVCAIAAGMPHPDRVLYVDQRHPNAADSNPGTAGRPLRTIAAATQIVRPGDKVLVRAGTYSEAEEPMSRGVVMDRSGRPGAWIVFQAYPGERPLVRAAAWSVFEVRDAAYVEIAGFEITTDEVTGNPDPNLNGNVGAGITFTRSHHVKATNNIVRDCGGGGIGSGHSNFIRIEGNTVFNTSWGNIYNCSGISLWEGRDFPDGKHGWPDEPRFDNIIRSNRSFSNENRRATPLYGGQLTDGNGIIIDFFRVKGWTLVENNLCYNNGGRGLHVFESHRVVLRNNTSAWNCRTQKGDADCRANTASDILYANNLVVARPGQTFVKNHKPGPGVVYRSNLLAGFLDITEPALHGNGNLVATEADFLSADSGNPDLRIGAGSPALDRASASDASVQDIEGNRRPVGRGSDIGAYER